MIIAAGNDVKQMFRRVSKARNSAKNHTKITMALYLFPFAVHYRAIIKMEKRTNHLEE